MNVWSLKENVVIVTTFDNIKYVIRGKTLREWNDLVNKIKLAGDNKVYLKDYDENLYFSTIKNDKGKTHHKSLPEPKKPKALLQMSSTEQKKLKNTDPDKYYKMKKTLIKYLILHFRLYHPE